MKTTKRSTRRTFLTRALTAPLFVRAATLGYGGVSAPSGRVRMGLIGCGLHGVGWNLERMIENSAQQVVAVCDVDDQHAAAAANRARQHYGRLLGSSYQCDVYRDFRELVNRRDVDAVHVATPDHWHAAIAIMALRAGKHVSCEKPLALTVREGRLIADEVKRTGRVFQTAMESRSIDSHIQLAELVHGGYIGQVKHIKVLLEKGNKARGNDDFTVQPPPPYLDYDMWQGQAPVAPYCPARVHNTFRWNLAYSGGRLTDWGAHLIDLAQWATGRQLSGPVAVEGTGKFPPRDAVWNTASEFELRYRYADGLTMHVWSEVPGIKFEGTEGWIMFRGWRQPLTASNPKILSVEIPPEKRLHRPRVIVPRADELKGGEHLDFTDCILNGGSTYAPAEVGHRTATISHIGNIAMQLGRPLSWDPDREEFPGDAEANAMLQRTQREPWSLANIDSWINVG